MRYEFHPEALAEYKEAAHYYAGCQNGLELRFIAAVEHAIQQILEAPERYRFFDEDIRRCLTRVFPYAVLYTVEADFVLISVSKSFGQFKCSEPCVILHGYSPYPPKYLQTIHLSNYASFYFFPTDIPA